MLSKRGKVPGDVTNSFSGPAQMPFIRNTSAQPLGAELQAGWVSDAVSICESAGLFPPLWLHQKLTLNVFCEVCL